MAIEPVPPSVADLAADMLARTGGCILIAPMWGAKSAGTCMCPKGAECATPAKHGPGSWKDNGTRELAKVETFLRNPGTPNYSIAPQDDLFIVDVDGEDILLWANWAKDMALPSTLTVGTANGYHVYFWLPKGMTEAPAKLNIGAKQLVVRSAAHPGYVLGPGSVHATGVTYSIKRDADIAIFPAEALKLSKMTKDKPSSGSLITVTDGGGFVLEERYAKGGRYEAVRSYIAHLYNLGVPKRAREVMVRTELAPLFDPEYTEVELSGAIERSEGKLEERLGPPAVAAKTKTEPAMPEVEVDSLFMGIDDYRKTVPTEVEWIGPTCYLGGVSLLSGPPKAGKSTLIGNLLRARELGGEFLGQEVPRGPSVLVTEEGGMPVLYKTEGLHELKVLDRRAFIEAGMSSYGHLMTALLRWVEAGNDNALIIIDTLAIWAGLDDENDASKVTERIGQTTLLAQQAEAAVHLVHHMRKGGGGNGEGIRGSSAILGTVDHSVELTFTTDETSDDRVLDMRGRLVFPSRQRLTFDRTSMRYGVGEGAPAAAYEDWLKAIPAGEEVKVATLMKVWDLSRNPTKDRLRKLAAAGQVIEVPGTSETSPSHWRRVELIKSPDLSVGSGSVGERMAAIMASAPVGE